MQLKFLLNIGSEIINHHQSFEPLNEAIIRFLGIILKGDEKQFLE